MRDRVNTKAVAPITEINVKSSLLMRNDPIRSLYLRPLQNTGHLSTYVKAVGRRRPTALIPATSLVAPVYLEPGTMPSWLLIEVKRAGSIGQSAMEFGL